jgi:hypothetical protein
MGFGGSVLAMILTLKNNARPKRKAFEAVKDFDKNQVHWKTRLKFKTLPKDQLNDLKDKIREDARRKRYKQTIISVILFSTVLIFGIYFINNFIEKQNLIIEANSEQKKNYNKDRSEKYLYYLNDGYKWLGEEHYKNAKFQFNQANEIFPEDYRTKIALTTAFVYDCMATNTDCIKAQALLGRIEKEYPNEINVRDLRIEFDNYLKEKY